jgi:16S rRNA (cytosine967-C5)-methyltransferase
VRTRKRVAQTDEDVAWHIAVRARQGPHASKLLAEAFRAHRDWDAAQRKNVAETAYGLLRRGRTLEALAEGERDRRRVILDARAALDRGNYKLLERFNKLPDVQRIATVGSLPDWLAERFIADFGVVEAEKLARALAEPPKTDLRANPARIDRDGLIAALAKDGITAKPLKHTRFGVRLDDEPRDLFATDAFREGYFELQDEGSQRVAELVDPTPGQTVIDACAGEGGKTLALAAMLGGRGRIVACDISARKLEVLKKRAQRAGVNNVQTVLLEREGPLPPQIPRADHVLVDAPCSGIGTLRRNPELRHTIEPQTPTRLAREQRAIAARFAERTDRLVYATCTVLKQEDEESVAAIAAATGMTVTKSMRLSPHVDNTDGFFAAVLVRAQ